jgi:hypothetical protein
MLITRSAPGPLVGETPWVDVVVCHAGQWVISGVVHVVVRSAARRHLHQLPPRR